MAPWRYYTDFHRLHGLGLDDFVQLRLWNIGFGGGVGLGKRQGPAKVGLKRALSLQMTMVQDRDVARCLWQDFEALCASPTALRLYRP